MNKKRRTLDYALVVSSLVIIALVFFTFVYSYSRSMEIEKARADERFSDSLQAGREHIDLTLEEIISDVDSTAYLIHKTGTDPENIHSCIERQSVYSNATDGFVYDENGTKTYGETDIDSSFADTVKQTLETHKPAASDLLLCSDGEYRFAVAVPYSFEPGKNSVFMLLFPKSVLLKVVAIPVLNDHGYMAIVREDGSFVARSTSTVDDCTIDKIAPEHMQQALTGLTEIVADDGENKLIISGIDLGYNDWILLSVAHKKVVYERAGEITSLILMFSLLALVLFGILFGMIFWEMNKWNQKLVVQREKFKIAVNQSSRVAFEYNSQINQFTLLSEDEHIFLPKGEKSISLSTMMNMVYPADRADARNAIELLNKKKTGSAVVRMSNLGGSTAYHWYLISATRLTFKDEQASLIIGSLENIDERENERRYLRQRATTDSLTGLLNRAETERAIDEHISSLKADEASAFIIIDLDDFKRVNDCFGHSCGDKTLQFFAEKLRSTFRLGDIMGRLGGDEFVVYMAFTQDEEIVERRLMELSLGLEQRRASDDGLPEISSSAGYVMARPGDSFESVYLRADVALYKAKENGKSGAFQGV